MIPVDSIAGFRGADEVAIHEAIGHAGDGEQGQGQRQRQGLCSPSAARPAPSELDHPFRARPARDCTNTASNRPAPTTVSQQEPVG